MGQALVQGLDGHLLQVRVIEPDLLAIGDQQLLHRRIGVPAEQARALQRQLARGFLQLGAGAVQGQLGEAASDGLRLVQHFGQAADGHLVVSLDLQGGQAQDSYHQHADQSHGNPRQESVSDQSRTGAGAITSRDPLPFMGLTTPAISIASIMRAARL
ncbi:hypothetical protein D9M68_691050 [compost metagenome]